jgi:hypothetical protein
LPGFRSGACSILLMLSTWSTASAAASPSPAPAVSAQPAPQPPALNEASGATYVTSLPAGADVWVDGAHVGLTPILVGALYRGRHTLTLAKSGWITQDIAFRVVPNTVVPQQFFLTRLKSAGAPHDGTVMFHTPPNAKIRVDGIDIPDLSRPMNLSAGIHDVAVDQGAGKYRRQFTVLPETTTDLLLRDVPAARMPSVVAPVDSQIPNDAISIEHTKIVIRYRGHLAVGHLGDSALRLDAQTVQIDPAPVLLGGRLYLPIDVISTLAGT